MKLISRIRWLLRLALLQRTIRLILRAIWLGGAVYLLCWGVDSLWGLLPRSGYWVLSSFVVGFVSLLAIVVKPIKLSEFLWKIDIHFNLKEQISTAYEVIQKKPEKAAQKDTLEGMLVSEVSEIIPGITRKVIRKGWNIRSDTEAMMIVFMLLLIVHLSGMEAFNTGLPGTGLGLLPGLGSDPSFADVYSSGIPGDKGEDGFEVTQGAIFEERLGDSLEVGELSGDDFAKVVDALKQAGKALKDQATTADLGRALEDSNFERAANEIGSFSENIGRVSPEARLGLANGISVAGRELYTSQFDQISEVLDEAVVALESSSLPEMSSQLDRVSELLRIFSRWGNGKVYAVGTKSEFLPADVERLDGEGEEIEIGSAEDISNLLAIPGSGIGNGITILGGAVDFLGPSTDTIAGYGPTFYNYFWDQKDVVTAYFNPR